MSKFDRCIFISIAIGIWALAMTQVFQPKILQAGFWEDYGTVRINSFFGICPKGIRMKGGNTTKESNMCNYILTASYDDLLKYPDNFF